MLHCRISGGQSHFPAPQRSARPKPHLRRVGSYVIHGTLSHLNGAEVAFFNLCVLSELVSLFCWTGNKSFLNVSH